MTTIGIDLGTTHSVIAVAGRVQVVEGYQEPRYLEECDVTVIPSALGDVTFPSVVWLDAEHPDDIVVGYDARQRAEEGEEPIMFAKRAMGTETTFAIGGRTFTAKDAGAMVLRHLKRCAEEALGCPVTRAVVTHPAYFNPNQKAQTLEAAVAAGFEMASPEQLLMEPVAAALAYLKGVGQDPIRILTYDLGGGTLDVSVLERRHGVISLRAFDGNELLGGYNFDRALVQWMLDKARAKGRKIVFDANDPITRGRRARLLLIAESVKIKLAEQRTDKVKVPVRAMDVLVDTDGRPVPIQEQITREEFVALIAEMLEETITCCRRALAKAELEASEIDRILLVGGSSYGPWVESALTAAFPDAEVELCPEPDLYVAAGAAIQAAALPPITRMAGLRVELDVPARWALETIDVGGVVATASGERLADDARTALGVLLTDGDGTTHGPLALAADGRFRFADMALEPNAETAFRLLITDREGGERLSHGFSVVQDEDEQATEVLNVLPKPILVRTSRGLIPIAAEGETLPVRIEERFERLHDDDHVAIGVFMSGEQIGTIEVDGIPTDIGAGARVTIEVEITRANEMRGTATVNTRAGTVVARKPVRVTFPPVAVPSLETLIEQQRLLAAQLEEETENAADEQRRALLFGKGRKLERKVERLLGESAPDRQEVQQALRELNLLVHPPADDLQPARHEFTACAERCRLRIAALDGVERKTFEARLARLEAEGEGAYAERNRKRWAKANENLMALEQRLPHSGPVVPPPELPPTMLMKDQALAQIDQRRAELVARREVLEPRPDFEGALRARCDATGNRLDEMETKVGAIDDDLPPPQGLARIQLALRGIETISEAIRNIDVDVR